MLRDMRNHLGIAYGYARELEYQISLEHRLAFLSVDSYSMLSSKAEETSKVLNDLIRSLRGPNTAPKLRQRSVGIEAAVAMRHKQMRVGVHYWSVHHRVHGNAIEAPAIAAASTIAALRT